VPRRALSAQRSNSYDSSKFHRIVQCDVSVDIIDVNTVSSDVNTVSSDVNTVSSDVSIVSSDVSMDSILHFSPNSTSQHCNSNRSYFFSRLSLLSPVWVVEQWILLILV